LLSVKKNTCQQYQSGADTADSPEGKNKSNKKKDIP
jgi:hypothetical protein